MDIKCEKHPKYKAINVPHVNCPECWEIYLIYRLEQLVRAVKATEKPMLNFAKDLGNIKYMGTQENLAKLNESSSDAQDALLDMYKTLEQIEKAQKHL